MSCRGGEANGCSHSSSGLAAGAPSVRALPTRPPRGPACAALPPARLGGRRVRGALLRACCRLCVAAHGGRGAPWHHGGGHGGGTPTCALDGFCAAGAGAMAGVVAAFMVARQGGGGAGRGGADLGLRQLGLGQLGALRGCRGGQEGGADSLRGSRLGVGPPLCAVCACASHPKVSAAACPSPTQCHPSIWPALQPWPATSRRRRRRHRCRCRHRRPIRLLDPTPQGAGRAQLHGAWHIPIAQHAGQDQHRVLHVRPLWPWVGACQSACWVPSAPRASPAPPCTAALQLGQRQGQKYTAGAGLQGAQAVCAASQGQTCSASYRAAASPPAAFCCRTWASVLA